MLETCKSKLKVSTHSRPKAAGLHIGTPAQTNRFQHTAARRRLDATLKVISLRLGFNTQPPEGGWGRYSHRRRKETFQHTAARRRLEKD